MRLKPRILIVDDEETFRTTLGERLKVRGFETTALGSGHEALEELKKNPYDVILLDVKMPGMNGIETLAEIKKSSPLIEVIILTGHASVDAAVEIMHLGGYDYLLKPCAFDDLLGKIEDAYEKKVAHEQRLQKTEASKKTN